MKKAAEVEKVSSSGLRETILKLFKEHPDEVFRWMEVAKRLDKNPDVIKTQLHTLSHAKPAKIGRIKPEGKRYSYYGTIEAIRRFSQLLSD